MWLTVLTVSWDEQQIVRLQKCLVHVKTVIVFHCLIPVIYFDGIITVYYSQSCYSVMGKSVFLTLILIFVIVLENENPIF